ncbi:MAG: hypothetical protein PHW47_03835, partial [Lachnospira sp.]|nr:hypothetical protein [Lachnospira sp.]
FAKYYYRYQDTDEIFQYGDKLPAFDYGYQMWQYKSKGSVPGISGYVDMNIAFFSYSGFKVDSKEAEITVPKETITAVAGVKSTEPNIHDGVKAINSIGYEMEYNTYIYNSNGDSVDASTAYANAGIYKISYSFTDPKNGIIQKDITLNVVSPIQLNATKKSFTTQEGKSINLREGLSAKDANGKDATASVTYVITLNGVVVDEATAMNTTGQYNVTYSLVDSMGVQSTLKETSTLIVTPKETQASEQPSNGEDISSSSSSTEGSASSQSSEKNVNNE